MIADRTVSAAMAALWAVALLLAPGPAADAGAAELGGVSMEDSISVGGESCSLVGIGFRKKLVIKVYAAGLYLKEPTGDAGQAVNSDQPKALAMEFVYRKVEGEKLREAWREGFDANTPERSEALSAAMERFMGLFRKPALAGDVYLFSYAPGLGTEVRLGGELVATIEGADFMRALFAIWFGDKPADKGLKKKVFSGSGL